MGSQRGFEIWFRRRGWLALLLPAVAVVQRGVAVYRAGVDAWTVFVLVGFLIAVAAVVALIYRHMTRAVLVADEDGLVLETLLWGRAVVPWETVTAVRVYPRGVSRRVAVEVPDPEAILPVAAGWGVLPASAQQRLARSRRGRLTVPLLLTGHDGEQLVERLAVLADGRCPVLLES